MFASIKAVIYTPRTVIHYVGIQSSKAKQGTVPSKNLEIAAGSPVFPWQIRGTFLFDLVVENINNFNKIRN